MKILYQTIPSYFDLDISLIRELSKVVDIKVLIILSPESMHSSAFSIESIDSRCAIIPATEYNGLEKYCKMINLNDWYVANNPDNSIIHSLSLARKIRNFYRSNGFTFFHSTTGCKTATMNIPFYAHLKNKLYTIHDPIPHNKLSFFDDFVRRWMMFCSFKNVLLLSDSLLKPFCKRYYFPEDRIFFSRLSVYDFLLSYEKKSNPYGDYILFFGRIDEYKGVDVLIDAYQKSEVSMHGIKLVIAGKGNLKNNIKQLPNDIILINKYIENDVLANLINNCKFVVLPYLTATQSGCVMSAFAFNKPILATRVGDLPNEVVDGIYGSLCEPNNIEDLSEKIRMMCSLNLKIFEENIDRKFYSESIYSWNSIAKSLLEVYKTIEIK